MAIGGLMEIAIRVDDFGRNPANLPGDLADRGLRLGQRFHEAMQGLPYLAAVIPSTLDTDGLAWLQSKPDGMTIALHGLDHARVEFRGLDVQECRKRLARGKASLAGIAIEDLVLPFNAWELPLEEACYREGIRRVWGGRHHLEPDPSIWPAPPPAYPLGNLTFIPSWKPLYGAFLWPSGTHERPLCESMPGIMERDGQALLTLHLTWEASQGDEFSGVRWLVDQYGARVIGLEQFIQ